MEDTNRLIITDESGQEKEMEIILTFENSETGKNYVLFTDPNDDSGDVFAYTYDEDGNLDEVTDEAEFEMCSEVLGAFIDEEEDGEEEA
ncbi:MAG: DUF1292 domain-containing protein [Solobacterium sp.]|nr:DUF1292 domain-containing protein [Solobacterium sp.]